MYFDSKSFKRKEAEQPIKELRNPDGSAIWRREKADAAPKAFQNDEQPTEMPFRLKKVVPQRSRWRCHLEQTYIPG